jgi:preprotein translocase subunit YajC
MFISPAYAQALGDNANSLIQFAPFVLIFVVFYFFVIRPQQQKTKEHRAMLGALRRGDRIVTGGGIIGTVAKVVGDDELLVDIAEGMRVRVVRSTVTTVLAKTEPVAAKGDSDAQQDEAEADKGKGSARRAAGGK